MNTVGNEYLDLGKKKFFEYDRKGALDEFRKALSQKPDDPTALGWLAITLARLGEYDEAIEILEGGKVQECAEIYIAKGIIAEDRDGKAQLAIDLYSKAISIDPTNEHAYCLRGVIYSDQNDDLQAISDLNMALKINPSSYVYYIFGQVKKKQKDYQGALEDATRAIEINPENWKAWRFRAELREILEDNNGALADYNKAVELDPGDKAAWAERADLREDLGDAQGALADYNKAIELDPEYMWAIYSRGRLKRVVLSDKKGALADLNKAIELNPEYKGNWVERGAVREELGDTQGALADYNKVIGLDPEYPWAWYRRGTLKHYHFNDKEGALLDYNKCIILDPGYKDALSRRAQLLVERGEYRDALKDLNKALSIDNNFKHALSIRAELWMSLGKFELALADNAKYYELAGIPKFNFNDPAAQDIYNTVYLHFHENIKPTLQANDERFLEFWACALFWGEDLTQSLYQGKQTYAHHGKYGMGYICLTDRYLRIISLGDLSKKHGKEMGFGIGKKLLLAVLNNYDFRSTEKIDKIWVIPFKDLNGLYKEDNGFRLVTPSETWQVMILLADDDYAQTAFELARTGNLRKMIDIEGLRLKTKSTNSEEDIFEKIERLASLRDNGILTKEEFEQKKQELLARL